MKGTVRLPVLVACVALAAHAVPLAAQIGPKLFVRDFQLQSSALVPDGGATISSAEFVARGWYPVRVPTTVLRGLVANGVYPDPYVGMNNMRIPDANDDFNRTYDLARFSHLPDHANPWSSPWWYRAEIDVPDVPAGTQVWLNFAGINYRADVWLNGARVAGSSQLVGMFQSFTLPVTAQVRPGQKNVLAVRVHPLDWPGMPGEPQLEVFGTFGLNGGETGDIGKNVTMQSSIGWDWIPAVRDRNMGIWQDVSLSFTGPVDLRYPHIVTDLPLPDTSRARLMVSAELRNTSSATVFGFLEAEIRRERRLPLRLRRPVTLATGSDTIITLSPDDYWQLTVEEPALWWPVGYGDPALYDLDLRFTIDGAVSDRESLAFGIREVGSEFTTVDGWARRNFTVNGRRIHVRGGAWVPDLMLARDRQRYRDELRLSRDANFNMVRIWGGGVTPPDDFFQVADSLGLLVWHDFWITGDCQGTWNKGTRDWPIEGDVFIANAVDAAKRLRNHPSLLAWSAGNEGYPRRELYSVLRDSIAAKLDGTRPFLPTSGYASPDSTWGLSWPDDHETGAYSGGPYWWVEPADYFARADSGKDWLFKDEVGIPSLPPLTSLERFIPDLDTTSSTLTDTWGYHDAAEGNGRYSEYDRAIRDRYGEPTTMREYALKAQVLNAESYRAVFEAAQQDLTRTAGVILWKTNSAWPSVMWQVYDWYLRPNAGYYYAKKASEPVHVQLHPGTFAVTGVNTTFSALRDLTLRVDLYDLRSQRVGGLTRAGVSLDAERSSRVLELEEVPGWDAGAFRFVRLRLEAPSGETVSENFYWLAPGGDFRGLDDLPAVELTATARQERRGDRVRVAVTLTNPGPDLAFFVNPVLVAGPDGEEILPTFWSDNWFSILPGESRRVVADVDAFRLRGREPHVRLGGWNVKAVELRVDR
ncbi:MAG: glycoside hydrolase family 2 TIM barrel-domain containing protein [Gemmatimonadota bacterium]|jgi:exo-1,4-beta-D-glucosaminidase